VNAAHGARIADTRSGRQLFGCLLVLIIALPWPHGANRDWAWSLFLLLAGALMALTAWKRLAETSDADLPWPWPLRFSVVCFLASITVAALHALPLPRLDVDGVREWWPLANGVDPAASLDALLKSMLYASVFLLTVMLTRTRSRLKWLLGAIVVSGLAQSVYGTMMVVTGLEWGYLSKKVYSIGLVSGTYVNRNHFAHLAVMSASVGIGVLMTLMLKSHSMASTWRGHLRDLLRALLGPKGRLRLALIVIVIALVMTRSRMGNASFFIALLSMSVVALAVLRPLPKKILVLLVSIVAIDIAIVGRFFGVEAVVERITETELGPFSAVPEDLPSQPAASDRDRRAVVPIALRMFSERPWFGHGAGSFYSAFPPYRTIDFPGFYDHAHNDYLESLVDVGVVGALPRWLPVLLALALAFRLLATRGDPLLSGTGFGIGMALLASSLHSTVEFVQQIPANAALVAILCGAACAANRLPRRVLYSST
jgi:O-antigen ligase